MTLYMSNELKKSLEALFEINDKESEFANGNTARQKLRSVPEKKERPQSKKVHPRE